MTVLCIFNNMKMNRKRFLIITIVPTIISGTIWKILINHQADQWVIIGLFCATITYINIIHIIRMKYIGYTNLKIIKTFIPFFGIKYFIKMFYKDEVTRSK